MGMAEAGQQRLADDLPQRRLPNIRHSFPTGPDHHPLRAEVLVCGGPLEAESREAREMLLLETISMGTSTQFHPCEIGDWQTGRKLRCQLCYSVIPGPYSTASPLNLGFWCRFGLWRCYPNWFLDIFTSNHWVLLNQLLYWFIDVIASTAPRVVDGFQHVNGIFRILNWRYLPYIRPIFEAYVRVSTCHGSHMAGHRITIGSPSDHHRIAMLSRGSDFWRRLRLFPSSRCQGRTTVHSRWDYSHWTKLSSFFWGGDGQQSICKGNYNDIYIYILYIYITLIYIYIDIYIFIYLFIYLLMGCPKLLAENTAVLGKWQSHVFFKPARS